MEFERRFLLNVAKVRAKTGAPRLFRLCVQSFVNCVGCLCNAA